MTEMNKRTIYRLLREIKRVATESSLTGSLAEGIGVLVEIYNRCLEALADQGDTLVKNLFPTLNAKTNNIDEVGAAAALLSGYVRPEDDRPGRFPTPPSPPSFPGEDDEE